MINEGDDPSFFSHDKKSKDLTQSHKSRFDFFKETSGRALLFLFYSFSIPNHHFFTPTL